MPDRYADAYPSTTRHEPKPAMQRESDDDLWDAVDNHEEGRGHEICDACGDQMWWDEAGIAWRCWTCETRYE